MMNRPEPYGASPIQRQREIDAFEEQRQAYNMAMRDFQEAPDQPMAEEATSPDEVDLMPVSPRPMAEGGPVGKTAREQMDSLPGGNQMVFTPVAKFSSGGQAEVVKQLLAQLAAEGKTGADFFTSGGKLPVTAATANDLMVRSMTTGVPTAEFDRYGGYEKVKKTYEQAGGQLNLDNVPAETLTALAQTVAQTGVGDLQILKKTGVPLSMVGFQNMLKNGIDPSSAASYMKQFGTITPAKTTTTAPVLPLPGPATNYTGSNLTGVEPVDYLSNLTDSPVSFNRFAKRRRDSALAQTSPTIDYSSLGVGAVGDATTLASKSPSIVSPTPFKKRPKLGAAGDPNSYFALTPETSTGLAPGTAALGSVDMPLYAGKTTLKALEDAPNLSPGMLGGVENAGYRTDRLGNRIYVPGAAPLFGFAKGGDVSLEALSDDDPEEVINTDPVGTAQKMMSDFNSVRQTSPKASPTPKAIKQTKSAPAKSGSAKMEYEALVKGDLGAMGSSPPAFKDTDSAQAQMRELARIYQLKAQAAKGKARGFSADTFGAPTLEQPTLTKDKLTKKRFNKGGEAKKPEGDVAEPLQSPEEQPVTEESSASRALGAFVSRLKEGAKGYLGLDPGISGSDSYRTGQALSNMPGVGAPAAVAGIFIGKGAKGWNNVSNALAKKATKQGAAPEEVWRTTGNFKAPDGQWRQEISDADAQMRESIFQGPANRILSHPELFANYPDLGKIMTSKDPYTTRSVLFSGAAGPDALIRLGTAGGKNENAKGMLHELQHAIQFKEGFGQGGSKDMAFTDPKAFEILNRIRTNVARPISIDEYAKEAWQSSNVTPEIAAMYQKYLDYHKKSLKTMDIEAQKTAGREYYNRLLGEAEARAVEARKSYTMDERLQLIPSRSYRTNGGRDIIPLDQLIVKRSKGSPEEGELLQEEIDAASRPALGNPSIARQVASTRASQAARSNDVNTLPDPQTYAFIQGLLGEAPDQIGFSSMHPDYDKIMGRGEQGMVTGGVSMIGPAAKALKALTKAGVKTVKPAASAAAGAAQDLSSGTERMAIAQRNAALPVKQGGLGLPTNNTAMDRALAMGFDTEVFHGTSKDFLTFNPDKAVFAAELPEIANLYARYTKGDGQRIMPLRIRGQQLTISDMNNGGKTGQFGYNLAKKLNLPEKEIQKLLIPQVRYPNGELIPDVKNLSTTFSDLGEREIINRLPKYGIDRLKVTDMPDMGGTQTQYMIPAGSDNIRSSFAAYDPFRRTAAVAAAMGAAAPDLLAGQEDKTNLRNKAR
jgi:hypothetical protein